MRNFWVLIIASVLFVSLSGISFAQGGKAPAKTAPVSTAQAKAATLKGKVVLIDTAKSQVIIENKKGIKTTLAVDAAQIKTLKVDDKVIVTFKADGKTVETIQVTTTKDKKK
jgi:hypothetical protein